MNPFEDDPAALALAIRLAKVDFSADSRVRHTLRARLVGAVSARRFPPAAGFVLGALASLLVIVATRPMWSLRESPLPVLSGRLPSGSIGAEPVFERWAAEPVFEKRATESLFETRPAEVLDTRPAGSIFEARRTSLEELFVRPVLE